MDLFFIFLILILIFLPIPQTFSNLVLLYDILQEKRIKVNIDVADNGDYKDDIMSI